MKKKSKYMDHKFLSLFVTLFLLVSSFSAKAANVTISSTTTFATADASDGTTDGKFTVTGNLTITSGGSITCVATSSVDACNIKIIVSGDMEIQAGGSIHTESTFANSAAGNDSIVVGGSFIMRGPSGATPGALINSGAVSSGSLIKGKAGSIKIRAGGIINLEPSSVITAFSAHYTGGTIVIIGASNIDIDGDVLSESTGTGAGNNQGHGGDITITTPGDLLISDSGFISSKSFDPGADLIHLCGCHVTIYGVVQSTGSGHAVPHDPPNHLNGSNRPDKPANSTAGIEVCATTILIDNLNHLGQLNADLFGGGGNTGESWIDLIAKQDITIIGSISGNFAVHANGTVGNSDNGGVITVISTEGKVTFTGRATQTNGSSKGGTTKVEAKKDVVISDATMEAKGSTGSTGTGGTITLRSFGSGSTGSIISNSSSVLNVTGHNTPNGHVNLTACVTPSYAGTIIPASITPVITTACGNSPAIASYVEFCCDNAPCTPTSSTTTVTACDTFTWNGNFFDASGTFSVTFTNAATCDSVAFLVLTINHSSTSTTEVTACDSFIWNGTKFTTSGTYTAHFTNSVNCDSTAILILTIGHATSSTINMSVCDSFRFNGILLTVSGTTTVHFTNSQGCDSTVTLILIVRHSTTSTTTVSVCDSFIWNGTKFFTSGTFTAHFTNSQNCDSTATLILTIRHSTTSTTNVSVCDSFIWNGTKFFTSGTFTAHFTNSQNCDSTAILILIIRHSTTSTSVVSACDSFIWNGTKFTTSGTFTAHFTNSQNCDSTAILILTIRHSTTSTTNVSACDSFIWNGTKFFTSGTFTAHFTNSQNCDSTAILILIIRHSTTSTTVVSACDSFIWNGTKFTTSGTFTRHFTNSQNCDSTAILILTIRHSTTSTTNASACDSFVWNGTTFKQTGTFTRHFTNSQQCDSTAILILIIRKSTTSTTTRVACDSFFWNGTKFTSSGTFVFHFTNSQGCDSAATLILTINHCGACAWCNKGAVMTQCDQNMADPCAQPDIIVDLRLGTTAIDTSKIGTSIPATGSLQSAVNYMNADASGDFNGDGYLFIGVIATDCENTATICSATSRPAAGDSPYGIENVIITNTHTKRLNVFGCSVTIWAADKTKPVITIQNGVGKISVLDIHVKYSNVEGYLVKTNGDLVVVKNGRAMYNDIGIRVTGNNVQITGSPEISHNRIGVELDGNGNILRTNTHIIDNSQYGIYLNNGTGTGNETDGNVMGASGHANGIGTYVAGNNNNLHDDNNAYNSGNGLVVTGSYNTIHEVDAANNGGIGMFLSSPGHHNNLTNCKQIKYNGGDGIKVTGSTNTLDDNESDNNGGNGILADISGGATGNKLHSNTGKTNSAQGIRACSQTDLGDNEAESNGMDPQMTFNCANPANAKFDVVDIGTDRSYKYDATFNLISSAALTGNNADPNDCAAAGTNTYVLDKSDKQVFRYIGAVAVSKTLKELGGGSLSSPNGMAISGNDLWVADGSKKKLYKYSLSAAFTGTGNINALQEIAFSGNNGDAEGLAIDATYLYVLDNSDKQFYRYPRAGGAGVASKVMKDNGGSGLGNPIGAVLDGTTMWIVDDSKDKASSYALSSLFSGAGNLNASAQYALYSANLKPTGIAVGTSASLMKTSGANGITPSIASDDNKVISVYPNPAFNKVTIVFTSQMPSTYTIHLTDMLGRVVKSEEANAVSGNNIHVMNLEDIAHGVYLVEIQIGTSLTKVKLVIQ